MQVVITVVGRDKPGIIAAVSRTLADRSVNIEDISQTILQGNFTMMMVADCTEMSISIQQLRDDLNRVGDEIGMTITVQHEAVFQSMHRI